MNSHGPSHHRRRELEAPVSLQIDGSLFVRDYFFTLDCSCWCQSWSETGVGSAMPGLSRRIAIVVGQRHQGSAGPCVHLDAAQKAAFVDVLFSRSLLSYNLPSAASRLQ